MKIGVIGGGPAGLYFARLIRELSPTIEVDVYERNPADATFGFGVGFAARTLRNLEEVDSYTHRSILDASVGWDGISLYHAGQVMAWHGFGLSGISRMTLLTVLQGAAREAGARLHFERAVQVSDLDDCDVVVAADGARSATRQDRREEFEVEESFGPTRYMWIGANGPFERTTFCIRSNEAGTFAIHGYPYADGHVTLVAETDEDAWQRAGFEQHAPDAAMPGTSDEWSVRYLEDLFSADLGGHRVLMNNSRWFRFLTVRCRRWWTGNAVLLGDAAHTAHPSVAAGTKMAMEGAIALAQELAACPSPAKAFERYDARHRPRVERIQRHAEYSHGWWGTISRRIALSPAELAFSYMTRTGVVGYQRLRELAPALVEKALAARSGEGNVPAPGGPLALPLDICGQRLSGRLLVVADDAASAHCTRIILEPRHATRGHGPAGVLLVRRRTSKSALLDEVRAARATEPALAVAAELPAEIVSANGGESEALTLAAELRDAGCGIVALSPAAVGHGHAAGMRVAERIRLDLSIPTLAPLTDRDLDRAAADVLAGRIDLVSVTSPLPDTNVRV